MKIQLRRALVQAAIGGLLLGCLSTSTFAETAKIEMFSDASGSMCALADQPGLVAVYVFLTAPEPIRVVGWFKAVKPACWNATFLSDAWPADGAKVGGTQTKDGISIGFGVCKTSPVRLLDILFLSNGSSPACCAYQLEVLPGITYARCSDYGESPVVVGPRYVTINADVTCPCQLPVAAAPTTWGRVKSLYR